MDAHYTPLDIARALVASVSYLKPDVIADLAAGEGNLLLAAEAVWPAATFRGTDIDRAAIRRLSRLRPTWQLGQCDLRLESSRRRSRFLATSLGLADLLLLNPPFSCRGGTRFAVQTSDGVVKASTALSFLLIACGYAKPTGVIAAVLPSGSLHNVKDMAAWNYIRNRYTVRITSTHGKDAFPGATASTVHVRLEPHGDGKQVEASQSESQPHSLYPLTVQVVRGCCPAHLGKQEPDKPALVHYTDLREARVFVNGRRGFGEHRCVKGPAVLIPRVGLLTERKVAILDHKEPVMISDCVIALKTKSRRVADAVRDRLVEHLETFRAYYVGTGAPSITLGRLSSGLRGLGINVDDA